MPFNIGPGELIVVLIIALIVVGPGKLPDVGSALGKSIREFRKAATDVKESVAVDASPAAAAPAAATAVPAAPPALAAPSVPPIVPVTAPPAPSVEVPAASAAVDADRAMDADSGTWPSEVAPVDEQQPTASA